MEDTTVPFWHKKGGWYRSCAKQSVAKEVGAKRRGAGSNKQGTLPPEIEEKSLSFFFTLESKEEAQIVLVSKKVNAYFVEKAP